MPRTVFSSLTRSRLAFVIAIVLALTACWDQKPPTDATWDNAAWDAPTATWK